MQRFGWALFLGPHGDVAPAARARIVAKFLYAPSPFLRRAQNCISKIENLGGNTNLQTLLLGDNRLRSDGIELVLECPSITCLDVQNNCIDDPAVRPPTETRSYSLAVGVRGRAVLALVRRRMPSREGGREATAMVDPCWPDVVAV